jgi:cold shock CspA family protein
MDQMPSGFFTFLEGSRPLLASPGFDAREAYSFAERDRSGAAMPIGQVKCFNDAKEFGFLKAEGIPDDVFAHLPTIRDGRLQILEGGDLCGN